MTAGRPGRSTRTSGEVGITTFHQVTGMFAGLTVRRIPIASGLGATLATPVTVCQLTTASSSRQWTGELTVIMMMKMIMIMMTGTTTRRPSAAPAPRPTEAGGGSIGRS